jgi:hypothetical protein
MALAALVVLVGACNVVTGANLLDTSDETPPAADSSTRPGNAPPSGASTPPADATNATDADSGVGVPPKAVAFKDVRTASNETAQTSFALAVPNAAAGDVLVATLALGNSGNTAVPVITAPSGFTLAGRVDVDTKTLLASYVHVATATEPTSYVWTSNLGIEGELWMLSYSNVDTANPVDVINPKVSAAAGPGYTTGTVSTKAGAAVIATFASHAGSVTTWSPSAGLTARINMNNGDTRSAFVGDVVQRTAGTAGPFQATASIAQDYALMTVLALRPAP